tara:strand:+ start:931 stop:1554 length:624 start_codon:yes stop_codon:yes gene_type:complete
MTFWFNKPSILFDKNEITEIWLNKNNSLDKNLNAITRLIFLLTFIGYLLTRDYKIVITSIITIIVIIVVQRIKKQDKIKSKLNKVKEGFKMKSVSDFVKPTKNNPMMNVMLPDISDDPNRNAANPSFSPKIKEDIETKVKDIGLDSKLFSDLGENILWERESELSDSMKRFYTTANSRVVNDQKAFAKFCFNNTASCKDGLTVNCKK